jgi:hypothetical protein
MAEIAARSLLMHAGSDVIKAKALIEAVAAKL